MKLQLLFLGVLCSSLMAFGQDENPKIDKSHLASFEFRGVGPALTSGRIADLLVHPEDRSTYYVAVASGGVWKTENAGTSYDPVFDKYGSYSIGCLAMAPSNHNVIWVGTGENNNQRSVAYGDGVYKSEDAGKSFTKMGLENSEHIAKIIVHPEDENIVYVAAYGPLWSEGGDRGIYKSVNGGKTWERILHVSENTGFSDLVMDPENADVLYAAAHQRRRHVWTYISGGPESALYKSVDGGANWEQVKGGFPQGDIGRISVAISPQNSDYVYAMVEESGVYRSSDRGASWKKMSDYSSSGNYYVEIMPHPTKFDWLFSMDTYGKYSEDGGATWKSIGNRYRHVDDHAFYVDPNDPNYYLIGCDGGIYESYDRGETWVFMPNLPVTQFYKVSTDNDYPFYNIFGGTQDNFSMGGPSQTINNVGIRNEDWFLTKGGDGFETQVDPTDPNIIYTQSQYGYLVRFDKKSGEKTDIKPYPQKGEEAHRWNWDAPLLISPHDHKTLYFAANKLFKSTDRGNSWEVISDDLSRGIDRNKLPVMGRVWGMDAVAKNRSTTIYGNIVALDESPVQKGLLYVGTDDGLVWVSEDDGENWTKYESFPGVPDRTYVNYLKADLHDANTVYAAFNNHKNGDFKPYVLKSTDMGKTWKAIQNNLPERGSVYCLAQDHVKSEILFVGTEFGVFTSLDGGSEWIEMSNGLPTIAIRDMEIQQRENDLVLASFGRGFYVLDNYSALRELSDELLKTKAHIFKPEKGLMYNQATPLQYGGKGFRGERYYTAPNPDFGLTFYYYYSDAPSTIKEERKKEESKIKKENGDVFYPSPEEIRAEDREESPFLYFTITDSEGNFVRRMKAAASEGVQKVTWDYRYTDWSINKPNNEKSFYERNGSFPAMPGKYFISISEVKNGVTTRVLEPQSFECISLNNQSLPAENRDALMAFYERARVLSRRASQAEMRFGELKKDYRFIKSELQNSNNFTPETSAQLEAFRMMTFTVDSLLEGDQSLSSREFETVPGINERIGYAAYYAWNSSSKPTTTQMMNLDIAESDLKELEGIISEMEVMVDAWLSVWKEYNDSLLNDK